MKTSLKLTLVLALALFVLLDDVDAKKRRRNRHRFVRRKGPRRLPPPHPVDPVLPPHPPVGGKDCGEIPHLINGFAIESTSGIQYACQPGFRLEGTNVITCIDGRWTVAPRCVRQLCPTPLNVAFATITETSNSGTSVVYQCHTGYSITNGGGAKSKRVNCNTSTQMWEPLPTCSPHSSSGSCQSPPVVANARSTLIGNTATYECLTGYKPVANRPTQLHCVNHQWQTQNGLPECEKKSSTEIRCNMAPPCGDETISRGDVASSYAVGEKITYNCRTGYRIKGSNNNMVMSGEVECKSDGTWTDVPMCEPKDCGDVEFGAFNKQDQPTMRTYQSTYTYQCLDNYMTTSTAIVTTCNADGQWSLPRGPDCVPEVCLVSALPASVTANTIAPSVTSVQVGLKLRLYCAFHFRRAPGDPANPVGYFEVDCQNDMTWAATDFRCVEKYPKNCREYFSRDNLWTAAAGAAAVTVTIDKDGKSGSAAEYQVQCRRDGDNVCTAATAMTNTLTGASTCARTDLAPVIDTSVLAGNNAGCDVTMVTYSQNTAALTNLVSCHKSCRQTVTITCTAAEGMYTTVRRNGETFGQAFSGDGVGLVAADFAPATLSALSGRCTCGSSTCRTTGCACSTTAPATSPAAATTDTIVFSLDGTNQWVTHIGRATKDNAAPDDIGASEYDVSVGDIDCCEPFVH